MLILVLICYICRKRQSKYSKRSASISYNQQEREKEYDSNLDQVRLQNQMEKINSSNYISGEAGETSMDAPPQLISAVA
jgi:hypothetical protein